jgi:hypothetical protein
VTVRNSIVANSLSGELHRHHRQLRLQPHQR